MVMIVKNTDLDWAPVVQEAKANVESPLPEISVDSLNQDISEFSKILNEPQPFEPALNPWQIEEGEEQRRKERDAFNRLTEEEQELLVFGPDVPLTFSERMEIAGMNARSFFGDVGDTLVAFDNSLPKLPNRDLVDKINAKAISIGLGTVEWIGETKHAIVSIATGASSLLKWIVIGLLAIVALKIFSLTGAKA